MSTTTNTTVIFSTATLSKITLKSKFLNIEEGTLNTYTIDSRDSSELWFLSKDVAKVLLLSGPSSVNRHVSASNRRLAKVAARSDSSPVTLSLINMSGLKEVLDKIKNKTDIRDTIVFLRSVTNPIKAECLASEFDGSSETSYQAPILEVNTTTAGLAKAAGTRKDPLLAVINSDRATLDIVQKRLDAMMFIMLRVLSQQNLRHAGVSTTKARSKSRKEFNGLVSRTALRSLPPAAKSSEKSKEFRRVTRRFYGLLKKYERIDVDSMREAMPPMMRSSKLLDVVEALGLLPALNGYIRQELSRNPGFVLKTKTNATNSKSTVQQANTSTMPACISMLQDTAIKK